MVALARLWGDWRQNGRGMGHGAVMVQSDKGGLVDDVSVVRFTIVMVHRRDAG